MTNLPSSAPSDRESVPPHQAKRRFLSAATVLTAQDGRASAGDQMSPDSKHDARIYPVVWRPPRQVLPVALLNRVVFDNSCPNYEGMVVIEVGVRR